MSTQGGPLTRLLSQGQDEHGWTAWDYARAILEELQTANQEDDEGGHTSVRFLTYQASLAWDGALTEVQATARVPLGTQWKLLGMAVGSGLETAELTAVVVYRNAVMPSAVFDVIPATVGSYQAKAPASPISLGANTLLVFRFRSAAAVAAGNVAFVNLAVEQTHMGPRPRDTDGGGEF